MQSSALPRWRWILWGNNVRPHRAQRSARNVGYPQNSSSPPSPLRTTLTVCRACWERTYFGKNEASASGSSSNSPTRGRSRRASVAPNSTSWWWAPNCRATGRGQLRDGFEDRMRRRNTLEGEVAREALETQPPRHARALKQRADLGSEREDVGARVVVEWLLADAVSRQRQSSPRRVPDGEGELSD